MNRGNLATEVLVRSGKDTTSGWVTDTMLNDWLSQSHRFGAGYKKWPFTEGRTSTTFATTSETWDFEGYKADSFRIITVGDRRLQKLNFEDYLIFKEESPSADDRVYSDFGGLVYVNTGADVSGTMTAYGQYMPANFDATDDTTETVFSEGNDEGNQAVIEEAISYVFRRDGKAQESIERHLLAKQLLDELWKRVLEEQYAYQTHPDRGGQYRRFDVLKGSVSDEILKRDQF
jgi:hypothetical protein